MDLIIGRTREFIVDVPNQAGSLAKLTQALGKEDVNILGFGAIGTGAQGIVHLITDDEATAETALETEGLSPRSRDALLCSIRNEPGELGRLAAALGQAGINIDASFITATIDGRGLRVAFSISDAAKAEEVLMALSDD